MEITVWFIYLHFKPGWHYKNTVWRIIGTFKTTRATEICWNCLCNPRLDIINLNLNIIVVSCLIFIEVRKMCIIYIQMCSYCRVSFIYLSGNTFLGSQNKNTWHIIFRYIESLDIGGLYNRFYTLFKLY